MEFELFYHPIIVTNTKHFSLSINSQIKDSSMNKYLNTFIYGNWLSKTN